MFYRTTCKIVSFFVNASRSGEEIKKGTFLEKKGGYFKLSGENILTSILSAFHPFLTLPNDDLKRERGTFLSLSRDLCLGWVLLILIRFGTVKLDCRNGT